MKRNLRVIPGDLFTWVDGIGAIEISDLHGRVGTFFQKIYDDAADIGFAVKSHKTGRSMIFVLNGDHGSAGPFWEYESLDNPKIKIHVFND